MSASATGDVASGGFIDNEIMKCKYSLIAIAKGIPREFFRNQKLLGFNIECDGRLEVLAGRPKRSSITSSLNSSITSSITSSKTSLITSS